ncbi:MAG: HDOD domain-containing protein, partial [Alphaproteobacteria bacterium]
YPDIVAQGYAGTELGQLTKYEKGFMDTHHAVTGYYVAKSWQLPATAARIIRDHHNCLHYFDGSESIEPTDKDMMAILVMASHIAGTHKVIGGQEKDYEWERLKPLVLEHFKITDEQFAEIAQLG